MKILIVSAWYAPFIHPRAHRWTALAEHWAKEGNTVQVLTARIREQARTELRNGVLIRRAGFDSLKEWVYFWLGGKSLRGRVGEPPAQTGSVQHALAWIYLKLWKNLFFPDDACLWYFPASRAMRSLLEKEAFDVVITVSLPFTGHLLGLKLLSKGKTWPGGAPPCWIADTGDPFSFQAKGPNNPFLYQRLNHKLERKVLEAADAVVVTTEATIEKYQAVFGPESVRKMMVIPPLLSGNPASVQEPRQMADTRGIKLGYFGALYAPTRTPDALIELLQQIFVLRPDLRERIAVHLYGEIFPEFFARLNAVPNIHLHGLRSRAETNRAMQSMDILLNIGNTTDFQLPSKAVDYLASGKPVLNLAYVEKDPFAAFFQKVNSDQIIVDVLNIRVDKGMPAKAELLRWIAWIESEKSALNTTQLESCIKPFQVQTLAQQYLQLVRHHQTGPAL